MGFVNYDRHTGMKVVRALANANITTNTTTNGAAIDTGAPGAGDQAKTVVIAIQTGTITDGAYAVQVFEDDVVGFGTETQVPAGRVFGTVNIASTNDDVVVTLSVKLNKRFCRIKLVSTGVTTGGTNFNAVAILERF